MSGKTYISDPSYAPEFPRFSLRTLLIAMLFASLMLTCAVLLGNRINKYNVEVEERKKSAMAALDDTVQTVEAIRVRFGRAPKDSKELENLMGHAMPEIADRIVYYKRTSPNSYQLCYFVEWFVGFNGDFLLFDSTTPSSGWVEFCD
jgi:hypothetical protein